MKPVYFLFAALGYLIGSVPFALVIGKIFYQKDIRQYGSGNLGGSNAGRVLGKKAGLAVITLDVAKAVIPVFLTRLLIGENEAIVLGVMIAIGHCYPLFANFRGGKAVATSFGFVGAMTIGNTKPFLVLLVIPVVLVILIIKLGRYVSVGSMVGFGVTTISSFFIQTNLLFSLVNVFLWLFIIYRHRSNITRVIDGTENKITW
ncbi:MAG: glycerol-3-phosphate 1-O-acyltransferase PlsY [Erysipelotrichaceae bacterium]|nr:glycerol-3-phosphate 1-O-acyltransferase PlsY [Erysipelotrichaceae bacterium]